ncbi:MAG: protein-disulfide reductase DsbD domain-containing protein, partial [Verrucomicrobiota bacterium]
MPARRSRLATTLTSAALALLVFFTPGAARAAFFGTSEQHVKASLVAAETSVQPGRAFTVALRLEHAAGWHTYWIYAGTGYATTLKWDLPPGWTASAIQWPTPGKIIDTHGVITGNGYTGILYLPVTLTPPANLKLGETITLKAKAEWLMCNTECVPGDATLSLILPVSATAPELAPDSMAVAAASSKICCSSSGSR